MPANKNLSSPRPYQSLQDDKIHTGIISVTGTVTVDLGIGHNNFVPTFTQQASLAADVNKAPGWSWSYGPLPGQFTLKTWKATSVSNPTLIAATAAVNFSFVAYADSSVGV